MSLDDKIETIVIISSEISLFLCASGLILFFVVLFCLGLFPEDAATEGVSGSILIYIALVNLALLFTWFCLHALSQHLMRN